MLEKREALWHHEWESWLSTYRQINLDTYLSHCTKIKKKKRIEDLDIKTETLNLLKDNIGKNLEGIGLVQDFLNRTPIP